MPSLVGSEMCIRDSLCAAASLVTDAKKDVEMWHTKAAMAVLLLAGILIASVPGITVTHLFLIYGTLRSTTMLPTMLTLLGKRLPEKGCLLYTSPSPRD